MLGSRGLLLGLALVPIATNQGLGQLSKPRLVELTVLDNKGNGFGKVVRDGDRFVALDCRPADKIGFLGNFKFAADGELYVDSKYLGNDLRGENKNVLVRGWNRENVQWELVLSKRSPFKGRFRVKNGELKGWWVGLGPVEPAKGGARLPLDRLPRAPLILVKDKKDAAGFDWEDPYDEGRRRIRARQHRRRQECLSSSPKCWRRKG
jgi:hypothetical protein